MTVRNTACDRQPRLLAIFCSITCSLAGHELAGQDWPAISGNEIVMSIEKGQGVPVLAFVKQGMVLTGREFRYEKAALEGKHVRFTGTVRLANSEFPVLLQTMLYRVGLECVSRGTGDEQHFVITPTKNGWPVKQDVRAEYQKASALASVRRRGDLMIVTSIPLVHESSTRVAELMSKRNLRGVAIGCPTGGKRIILQGLADAVYAASVSCAKIESKAWLSGLLRMVPRESVGAAEFDVPARDAMNRILEVALGRTWRDAMDPDLVRTGKYWNAAELIGGLHASLEPRLALVLRPNRRATTTQQTFRVDSRRECPQWTFVFQIKKGESGELLSAPMLQLIRVVNENRRVFKIRTAFKLSLSPGRNNTAFEFAMPQIPGTGSLSMAVMGDRFVVGNSGPFLYSIFQTSTGALKPATTKQDPTRGLVWVDRKAMPALIKELARKDSVEVLEQGDLDRWLRLAFGK